MIQTGSSGSYFIRVCTDPGLSEAPLDAREDSETFIEAIRDGRTKAVAVFKPHDEEPYGSLNPKRVLLRKYLWWAMGRPCLIPSFSYLSEVGASLLDDRLRLYMVPSTRLEEIGSSAFSYTAKDREQGNFKAKIGSYQYFLHGYVNASTFLRLHPWPSRPRDLLEEDLKAENHAHGRARARARKGKIGKKAKKRGCTGLLNKLNCCSVARIRGDDDEEGGTPPERTRSIIQTVEAQTTFAWTKELMQDFRLELERLVCLDYLMRNTDRGLDNFMVKAEQVEVSERYPSGWKLTLAAIDNSLAFPWKHPAGIRSYPWGWLYLPTDLIGGNFSSATRDAFVPFLSSASWWRDTESQLEDLFRKDVAFDEKKFRGQMEVLRGQGWNLLESLRSSEEGPLELCARQKQLVKRDTQIVDEQELASLPGAILALTSAAEVITRQIKAVEISSQKQADQKMHSTAIQIQQKERLPIVDDGIQPQSLPEATNGDATSGRWQHASVIDHISSIGGPSSPRDRSSIDTMQGDEAIGKAYRGKSLGIDVLAEIDKSSNRTRRPKMRKASTGHVGNHLQGASNGRVVIPPREDVVPEITIEEDVGMANSIASLPSISQSDQGKPHFLKSGRRRNVSVGDYWSISSVLDRSQSDANVKASPTRIKVIIEVSK